MLVDWHAHYVPQSLLENMEKRVSYPIYRKDAETFEGTGGILLHDHYTLPVGIPHLAEDDFAQRISIMDEYGIEVQVLGLTALGLDMMFPEESWELVRLYNDRLAEILRGPQGKRFRALAAVSLKDVKGSVRELEYRVNEQGFSGVSLFATVDGVPLDAPRFEAFFAKVAELNVPIFIHAGFHAGMMEGILDLEDYGEGVLWGTLYHMSVQVAVNRLIASGLFDKYPQLRILLQSGGVAIPFLLKKYFWKHKSPDGREIRYEEIFRKHFYCETSKMSAKNLEALIEIIGEERVVFGSDFSFGPMDRQVKPIHSLSSDGSFLQTLSKNSLRLFTGTDNVLINS